MTLRWDSKTVYGWVTHTGPQVYKRVQITTESLHDEFEPMC